jgi:hypothetical protein
MYEKYYPCSHHDNKGKKIERKKINGEKDGEVLSWPEWLDVSL